MNILFLAIETLQDAPDFRLNFDISTIKVRYLKNRLFNQQEILTMVKSHDGHAHKIMRENTK